MKSKLESFKMANPTLEIQHYLRDIAQVHPDIPRVSLSGLYDPGTQNAVAEFQKKFQIPITGKIDFNTWSAIIREHKNCIHCIKAPKNVSCFPNEMSELKIDDKGNLICILQIILMNYKRKYKNYADIQLTGVFDKQTEEAIKQFQKFSGLPVTGKVDRQTWNILNTINETCHLYD